MVLDRQFAGDDVNEADNAGKLKVPRDDRVAHAERGGPAWNELVHERRRVGQTRRLDDDTVEGDLAHMRKDVELVQRRADVAADCAAEAPRGGTGNLRLADTHEIMVERDITEFVDDDGRVGEGRIWRERD
ncbi:MAG: hypothetical protein NVV59_04045 [Chitinophagaceae bacterium]|nr:hypothetical protein [Chitinophagaceae bacterium]